MGVSTDGNVALCHRFAGSDDHWLRHGARRRVVGEAAGVPRVASHRRARPTARRAGRGRFAPAAVITKRTRATDRPTVPTCTTANGFAAGRTRAWRSTAKSRNAIPISCGSSMTKRFRRRSHEASDTDQSQGRVGIEAATVPTQGCGRPSAGRTAAAARTAAHPERLFAGLLARLGSRSQRRHRRPVPAGRARSVRLPHGLLLAGAGARPVESLAGLDGEVRRRAEGLAQDRSDLPGREEEMISTV